jgi:hypothetical protein
MAPTEDAESCGFFIQKILRKEKDLKSKHWLILNIFFVLNAIELAYLKYVHFEFKKGL